MKRHTLLVSCMFVAACLTHFGETSGSAGGSKSPKLARESAPAAKRVAVQAAGRGNPYINFEDGVEISASYEGSAEMQSLLKENAAEPRALASADFDEDGVPDLICGYARAGGGIITLHRGNVDSIYQNSPEAQRRKAEGTFTDSAYLSPARVFECAIAADFVGAGDFDADGHWDVVIAARGGEELSLLPGDGKGSFFSARKIALPGAVTSLITGEINRADGLTDIVVGVVADDGATVMVFEGPEGALKAKPEIFPLPGEPGTLAFGQLDDDYAMDLAVGAGSELLIIHGRDRKLSLDEIRQAEVVPARLDTRPLGFEIRSIAAGDFNGENETRLALLTSDGTVRLIRAQKVADKKAAKKKKEGYADPEIFGQWTGAAQLICARVSTGPADDLVILNKDGHSLQIQKTGLAAPSRSALSSSVRVSTSFDFEGGAVAALPMRLNSDALSDLVVLQRSGSPAGILKTASAETFTVNKADDHNDGFCDSGDCTLREAINAANTNAGADSIAFNISGAGAHTLSPTSPLPTITDPVTVDGYTQLGASPNTLPNADNAVLRIELSGSMAGFSGNGLTLAAGSSVVRGLAINRFRRNAPGVGNGIRVITNPGNLIEGNFIGTDITGTSDQGNAETGVIVENTSGNRIGWTAPASRNVISGNDVGGGVMLSDMPGGTNLVQGNFIGTDITGTVALGNDLGVRIRTTPAANTVGGSVAGARNIISGNGIGVLMSSAIGAIVQGNFIGTDVNGSASVGNNHGVLLDNVSFSNTIGGTTVGARNVISGNTTGITNFLQTGTSGNVFQGNFIGVNGAGTAPLGNTVDGILSNGGRDTVFGGTAPGAGNVISFNGANGIYIQFGPRCFVLNNTISFNGGHGVVVPLSTGCTILGNSIFGNASLGINLGIDAVTANDPCDADSGANNLQNFPVLSSAISSGANTIIQGTLISTATTTFRIEFFANTACDPSGFGEGQTFIGSTMVTTATNCGSTFSINIPVGVPVGQLITATATDPAGNTSEFSQCMQVQGPPFDLCLQDESNGNILLVNSATGEYQFTNCAGVTLSAVGTLTRRGCLVTLQVNGPDHRILARIDTCSKSGTASVQILSQGTTFSIVDRNTTNNTCTCAGSG